jgi:hypothetical protein
LQIGTELTILVEVDTVAIYPYLYLEIFTNSLNTLYESFNILLYTLCNEISRKSLRGCTAITDL